MRKTSDEATQMVQALSDAELREIFQTIADTPLTEIEQAVLNELELRELHHD